MSPLLVAVACTDTARFILPAGWQLPLATLLNKVGTTRPSPDRKDEGGPVCEGTAFAFHLGVSWCFLPSPGALGLSDTTRGIEFEHQRRHLLSR